MTQDTPSIDPRPTQQPVDPDVLKALGDLPEEFQGFPRLFQDEILTDGRFSGATRGFCIGHVGPEAQEGGPIGLIKDGDIITIDAEKGTIDVRLTPAELEDRKREWKPRVTAYGSGALHKFAALVGPAHKGATTHPGFEGERHVYADI